MRTLIFAAAALGLASPTLAQDAPTAPAQDAPSMGQPPAPVQDTPPMAPNTAPMGQEVAPAPAMPPAPAPMDSQAASPPPTQMAQADYPACSRTVKDKCAQRGGAPHMKKHMKRR